MAGFSTPTQLYPESKPFDEQFLKVSELHTVYFWQAGNPNGKPVVFLHGGPGSGTSSSNTTFFDPAVYRIVLIDQRGCGKSTPLGELRENTTWDLVSDIEHVRKHLGIEKWLVFGGSWGSTLSLAYAESHPSSVSALILRGIYLSRRSELDFTYKEGANHIYPETWEPFINHIPVEERGDLMAAYYRRLTSEDESVVVAAAVPWRTWEDSTAKLIPDEKFTARASEDTVAARAGARIEAHYFYHVGFMEDGALIKEENIAKIRDIPAVAVQGRYDIVCPMRAAFDLKKAWGESLDLIIIPDAGHSGAEPGTAKALKEAADKFGRELEWK